MTSTTMQSNKLLSRPLMLAVAAAFAIVGCDGGSSPTAKTTSQNSAKTDVASNQPTAPAPSAQDAITSGATSSGDKTAASSGDKTAAASGDKTSSADKTTASVPAPSDTIATNGVGANSKTPAVSATKPAPIDTSPTPTAQNSMAKPKSQGPTGESTAQQPVVGKDGWSSHWNYTFGSNSNEIVQLDSSKAGDIASYLSQNPTQRIGLDGSNPGRVGVVREALIAAGVPAAKIQSGKFGDPQLRAEARVDVLVNNS